MVVLLGLVALAAITALTGPTTAAQAETVTLRADWGCPYVCDPGSATPGYAVEIAREVFVAAGHSLDVRLIPWQQALAEAREGLIDGVIGSSAIPGRGLVYPVEPIALAFNVLAVRKGERFAYQGVASLAGRRLGVISGYSYGPEIDAYIKAHAGDAAALHITSNSDDAEDLALHALLDGKMEVMIDDANVIIAKLHALGIRDRIEFIHRFEDDPLFIGFSVSRPHASAYAKLLSEGLVRLRGTGALERILARYGVPDWR